MNCSVASEMIFILNMFVFKGFVFGVKIKMQELDL